MTTTNEIKGHIVFDCDGTLISSQEGIIKGIQQLMGEVLKRDVPRDEVLEKYTADMFELGKRFGLDISDETIRETILNRWIEISNQDQLKYILFDGIKELLVKLSAAGYRLYVWTARDRMSTLAILRSLDAAKYFYEFRCLDDTIPKPHPKGLEEMLSEYDKKKVFVIGDSLTDLQGAREYRVKSIAALWCGHVNEESLDEVGADFKAKKPADCFEIIEREIKS